MARSTARVATQTPERYAKQLVSHLGHRVPVSDTPHGSTLTFGAGTGTVSTTDGVLVMVAEAPDDAKLTEVEDVLGRHLVRFGERQSLTVTWERDPQ